MEPVIQSDPYPSKVFLNLAPGPFATPPLPPTSSAERVDPVHKLLMALSGPATHDASPAPLRV